MSANQSSVLVTARQLLERPDPKTAGIWPRATALLARQVLEEALDELWTKRAPGLKECSARAQFLCLPGYLRGEDDLALRVSYAWAGLSRACHQHAYELPATASELQAWMTTVDELKDRVVTS